MRGHRKLKFRHVPELRDRMFFNFKRITNKVSIVFYNTIFPYLNCYVFGNINQVIFKIFSIVGEIDVWRKENKYNNLYNPKYNILAERGRICL